MATLDLSHNRLGPSAGSVLGALLASHAALTTLNLERVGLTERGAKGLAASLLREIKGAAAAANVAAAEASAPPPAEGSDAQATAAAAAVRHVLADQGSESEFLKAVALLKSAAAADKAGRGTEAALMYMAAADSVSNQVRRSMHRAVF